jgi:hypothetical protein
MNIKINNKENFDSTWNVQSAAIWYFTKLNWRVFPTSRNKIPLIEWSKYRKIKPTIENIKKWFADFSASNIGLITGESTGVVVIDIDPRHGGTDEDFKDIKTVKSRTGGGGFHIFFKYEPGLVNKAGIKEGIDIRGEGGYVVLPPSTHASCNKYEWINSPDTTPLAPLPAFVKRWLLNNLQPGTKSNWNPNILDGAKEGNRNESAASVAGKLLIRFPEKEWETEAYTHLKNWNAQSKPPLSEQELRAVFESIKKSEKVSSEEKNKSQASGTETTSGSIKQKLIGQPLTYTEIEEKVKKLLPNSQIALKLILAVAVSSSFSNFLMLWLLLVGVPSSGKTDLVRLIKGAGTTYYLDNLTQNAFISGERANKDNKVYDLLPLLDKKCLVIKDWTSIFSLDEKATKKLLGDLVNIYDKEFTKFSSRRGNISYASAFSQLGCITPATLNKHTNYMNMVGPRFLCYTMPSSTPEEDNQSYEQIFLNRDRSLIEKEARLYVSSYLTQLVQKSPNIKSLSKEVQEYLRTAAELMSNCRGIAVLQAAAFKNEEGEEVKYYEVSEVQIEEPWRAIQQLIILAQNLAFVVGKEEVGVSELAIIKEVVLSSMPADRSQALRIVKDQGGSITARGLTESSDRSIKTSRRLLDELAALKVLEKIKGSGTVASDYKIYSRFQDFLLLDPAEFMSRKENSGTETPHSIDQISITDANLAPTSSSNARKSEIEFPNQLVNSNSTKKGGEKPNEN